MKRNLSDTAANGLLDLEEDQLYELLGLRIRAAEEDVSIQGSFEPQVKYSEVMGPLDDLKAIGRRMFDRTHIQAYNLMCGTAPADKADRDKIVGALGLSAGAAIVTLSGVLASTFGIGAAFAGILAAIIIKRFAVPTADEGYKAMCELWVKHLPSNSGN